MDYSKLSPTASYFVTPVFFGGPMDGWVGLLVESDSIAGTVKHTGGVYSLVGFAPPDQAAAADQAVYEWVPQ